MSGHHDVLLAVFTIAVVDQKLATATVARALESGVNFFDTADVCSYGQAEELLGRALKDSGVDRDAVVIATKVRGALSEAAMKGTGGLNNVGLSRKHIVAACEASLRRLGTGHIDLYQVHGWDVATPMDETLRALDDLVRQGKVRYVGCSNWPARHLAEALAVAAGNGWERFVSLQAYYSLAGRDLEHELLPLCREEGLSVLPWSPLAGGFLTGEFRRGKGCPSDARRSGFDFPPADERTFEAVDALEAVAKARGGTIPQMALAWLLAQAGVTSVLFGAKTMAQLEDDLGAADLRLEPTEVAKLAATTAPRPLDPQWMVERQNVGR